METRKGPIKPTPTSPKATPLPPPKRPSEPPFRTRRLWQSWAALPARDRLKLSIVLTSVAAVGLFMSDQLEKLLPPPPAAPPTASTSP